MPSGAGMGSSNREVSGVGLESLKIGKGNYCFIVIFRVSEEEELLGILTRCTVHVTDTEYPMLY